MSFLNFIVFLVGCFLFGVGIKVLWDFLCAGRRRRNIPYFNRVEERRLDLFVFGEEPDHRLDHFRRHVCPPFQIDDDEEEKW